MTTAASATVVSKRDSDSGRLEALAQYCVLDSSPQEGFDRITRLANQIWHTPIALVSLLDNRRQFFKSRVGLEATETPIEWAFCRYAVREEAVLVVPDAAADDRFRNNPLVVGPPLIRFYAGAPLKTLDGYCHGTLCVIDTEPRTPQQDEIEALVDLAALTVGELELRRDHAQLLQRIRDNEGLVQEAYHRINNSFHLISSSIRRQRKYVHHSKVKELLDHIESQVQAVASLHRRLQAHPTAEAVDFDVLLTDMCNDLREIVSERKDGRIAVDSDKMTLPMDLATMLLLIAHELITNAVKYAFADSSGVVTVEVRQRPGQLRLRVADNGSGLPGDFDLGTTGGLGMRIVSELIERIGGTVSFESRSSGTQFTIAVPL